MIKGVTDLGHKTLPSETRVGAFRHEARKARPFPRCGRDPGSGGGRERRDSRISRGELCVEVGLLETTIAGGTKIGFRSGRTAGETLSPPPLEVEALDQGSAGRADLRRVAGSYFRVYGKYPDGLVKEENRELAAGEKGRRTRSPALLPRPLPPDTQESASSAPASWEEVLDIYREQDRLLVERVKRRCAKEKTPFIAFDLERLMENYRLLSRGLYRARVFFPVKCNDHPGILELLASWGSGFEVASWAEARTLLDMGVEPERIIFGSPVKVGEHVAAAYREGINLYAFDSHEEVRKLAANAPGCQVYLRLSTPEVGESIFPLSGKFGAPPGDALHLLRAAEEAGLRPVGLSFHVGSQCLDPSSWWIALATTASVWREACREGFDLSVLNIGGGFPVTYREPVLEKEVFVSSVNFALRSHFQKMPRLIVEPGRAMVGDVAVMVATVIGKARRAGTEWLYIDAGIYQGLVEAMQEKERFSYRVFAEGRGPLRRYNVGGPTCDSADVVARGAVLPELECGDRLYIMSAGAYTNVCATAFNGFEPPRVLLMSG